MNISQMQHDAFYGDPEVAYKLGRYHQFCLGTDLDIKIACLYYYMARTFNHLGAYLRLNEYLVTKGGIARYDKLQDVFTSFSDKELDELHSRSQTLSDFVKYHKAIIQNNYNLSSRYAKVLETKLSPRYTKPIEYINKEYEVFVPISQPYIHFDEFSTYVKLALAGDVKIATKLMIYYRFSESKNESNDILRDFWAYISGILGNSDCKKLFKNNNKLSLGDFFIKVNNAKIVKENESLYILLNYYCAKIAKHKNQESKYLKKLIENKIDARLIDITFD